jgi:transcription elongation factor Elf1
MIPYKSPSYKESSFNCPICNAYAQQTWFQGYRKYLGGGGLFENEELNLAQCGHCGVFTIWHNKKMIYPDVSGIAMANPDLGKEIIDDYDEARSIVNKSPRGAAALLRLAIQKLCKQLGEGGDNINDDIADLVKKGLPPMIQQSLDVVRVVGNNAVHPGQIDLKDDVSIANKLFDLINIIAQVMITQPKEIEKLYGALPDSQKKAIEKRDKT